MLKLLSTPVIVRGMNGRLSHPLFDGALTDYAISGLSIEWIRGEIERSATLSPDKRALYRAHLNRLKSTIEQGGGAVLDISHDDLAAFGHLQLLDLVDHNDKPYTTEERLVVSSAYARGLTYVALDQPANAALTAAGVQLLVVS